MINDNALINTLINYFKSLGSIYCTSDVSNPTPVYVVEGNTAVLQCGFESRGLTWKLFTGDEWVTVALAGDIKEGYKYSIDVNPATGLYYQLHIPDVGVSDVKKYKCQGPVNGIISSFYLTLDLLGRYYNDFRTSHLTL